jgi:hypothetical protein
MGWDAVVLVCGAAMPLSYAIQDALEHGRVGWMMLLFIVMIAMFAGYFTAAYDLRYPD